MIRSAVSPQYLHYCKCNIEYIQQFNKQDVHFRHNIAQFHKLKYFQVTAELFSISDQHTVVIYYYF